MNRRRGGFTLVEMIVALATSSIVVLAGMSFVMMCLRVQSVSYTDVSRQDTARVALTLVETLAERGELKPPDDSVVIAATGDKVVLYSQDDNIYVGSKTDGTLLMSNATLSTTVNDRLFTVTLTDNDSGQPYSTTVFCRNWPRQPGPYLLNKTEIFAGLTLSDPEKNARYGLLKTAVDQFGSDGRILDDDGEPTEETFAKWYNSYWGEESVPWCACFVSWCIAKTALTDKPHFANVNDGWINISSEFERHNRGDFDYTPVPGDMIFFNLNDSDALADHVGFVMRVDGDTIYTVEGNNAGAVVIAEYTKEDSRILGYGTLRWAALSDPS